MVSESSSAECTNKSWKHAEILLKKFFGDLDASDPVFHRDDLTVVDGVSDKINHSEKATVNFGKSWWPAAIRNKLMGTFKVEGLSHGFTGEHQEPYFVKWAEGKNADTSGGGRAATSVGERAETSRGEPAETLGGEPSGTSADGSHVSPARFGWQTQRVKKGTKDSAEGAAPQENANSTVTSETLYEFGEGRVLSDLYYREVRDADHGDVVRWQASFYGANRWKLDSNPRAKFLPGEQVRAWCSCYVLAGRVARSETGKINMSGEHAGSISSRGGSSEMMSSLSSSKLSSEVLLVNFGVGSSIGGSLEESCDKEVFHQQCRPLEMLKWNAVEARRKEKGDPWMEYFPLGE